MAMRLLAYLLERRLCHILVLIFGLVRIAEVFERCLLMGRSCQIFALLRVEESLLNIDHPEFQ